MGSTIKIDGRQIHIVTPFVGGGFGSKLGIHSETILAAMAARRLNQPVKVAMTRQQIFNLVGPRATTSQRVRLGAGRDGRLVAIAHEVNMQTNPREDFGEPSAVATRRQYAAPNRLSRHPLVPLDPRPAAHALAPARAP